MMKFLTLSILKIFDYFHKKKIINFLKKKKISTKVIFDIGGHHGESIVFFCQNFNVKKIYSFEPIKENYLKLEKLSNRICKKYKVQIIKENYACGSMDQLVKIKKFNDTSSSTIKEINYKSKYYQKKKLLLNLKKNLSYLNIKQICLKKYLKKKLIKKINILKIDTEGYEFEVLKGLGSNIKKVKCILFEHHYDDMVKKNYTFADINKYLVKNNFVKIFKIKMFFRKTFEYIYIQKV